MAGLNKTLARIKAAKVIAIIRAKNADLAIKRGLGTHLLPFLSSPSFSAYDIDCL